MMARSNPFGCRKNKAGIRSVIMTTVSDANIDEVSDIIDTVVSKKADVFSFARYCPTSEEKDTGIASLRYRKPLADCDRKFQAYAAAGFETSFNKNVSCWHGATAVPLWPAAKTVTFTLLTLNAGRRSEDGTAGFDNKTPVYPKVSTSADSACRFTEDHPSGAVCAHVLRDFYPDKFFVQRSRRLL